MNGKMAGGHLVIDSMKILIVIFINIEPLELCVVKPGGVAAGPWRAPLKGAALGQMAGGGIIDTIIADVINTKIIILNFWLWTAKRRLLRRASREP